MESLKPGTRRSITCANCRRTRSTQSFRDFLGKWNFPGDRAFESVDGFSGGERARLALALIAWRQPNVLLLDEPTNHLDLDMREALAEALSDFDGAIVLVSHDRHLIGLVSDTFWRVADGRVEPFDGDLDEYAAWLRARPAANGATSRPQTPTPRARAAAKPKARAKVNPHKLAKAEARVAELEAELATIEKSSWPIRRSIRRRRRARRGTRPPADRTAQPARDGRVGIAGSFTRPPPEPAALGNAGKPPPYS